MAHSTEAVYRAEQILRKMLDGAETTPFVQMHGSVVPLSPDRKFGDLASVQRYVDSVLNLNWIKEKYRAIPVTVQERTDIARAHYVFNQIHVPIKAGDKKLSRWAMRELVVLHELAHHFDPTPGKGNAHPESFVGIFVDLVSNIVSDEAGWILRTLFYDEGIK